MIIRNKRLLTSLNKHLDDLHNFFNIIKLKIQLIRTYENKIKGSCLNGLLPDYTFEFK